MYRIAHYSLQEEDVWYCTDVCVCVCIQFFWITGQAKTYFPLVFPHENYLRPL